MGVPPPSSHFWLCRWLQRFDIAIPESSCQGQYGTDLLQSEGACLYTGWSKNVPFGASAFYMLARWHKSDEVDSECTSHNSIVLAICLPKVIKFSGDLTKFWQKQVGTFFGSLCTCMYDKTPHAMVSRAMSLPNPSSLTTALSVTPPCFCLMRRFVSAPLPIEMVAVC